MLRAGQGKRLLPLTADRPKCLLPLAGRSLLEWQMRALAACGITDAVVVTGFGGGAVEEAATRIDEPGLAVRTVFKPFYTAADNIGSCYVARHEMDDPFVLLHGDTAMERREDDTSETQSPMPISVL